ncbi:MAG: LegC family aminotransferase [Pseudomonadota bacterium]
MTTTASQRIPLCEPHIDGNAWAYVKDCLDTGWVSSVGAYVDSFQSAFAARLGVGHAVAVSSGTAALHLALLAAGVQPGDEVVTSTLTFVAPLNAIRHCGADPVLIDAEPEHWQMDAGLLSDFLDRVATRDNGGVVNRETGRRIGAILPVHILGHPCDMEAITTVAERHGLAVIEDATEALGSACNGRPVGTWGRLGCFSFNGNKLMTTGAGGMVVGNDPLLVARARHLSTQAKLPGREFIHDAVGYNYRLSNLHAALGLAQLEQLESHVAAKARIASLYDDAFRGRPDILPQPEAAWAERCFWLYTARLPGRDSRALIQALDARGIDTRPLWQPLHLGPVYGACRREGGQVAEMLYRECVSLPCSVGLSEADQRRVIAAVLATLDTP